MKRIVTTIILILISAFTCLGQDRQEYTSIKDAIQQLDFQTFCIKAHYAGTYDSAKLVFFIKEDDYIIPVRLQKRDLGAENRFLAMDLKEGDVVIVKGILHDVVIDDEKYKGLIDAVFIDEDGILEEEPAAKPAEDMLSADFLDVKPQFRGGDANAFSVWVNSRLKYPASAKKNGIQGKVTLQFTIEPNGKVTNVEVLRGVDKALDEEAVRVVSKSPRWKPGYVDGKPVRVTYTFPVIFQLR